MDVLQISPKPGFVVKTKLVDTGMKVFVNVCQHERIGESNMVKKLDKDGQEVRDGLSILTLHAISVVNRCHSVSLTSAGFVSTALLIPELALCFLCCLPLLRP